MPSSEALTDDYLAQLLANDAKDRTIKHSSYGLQAILPKSRQKAHENSDRPTTNAPKPNTRFLKNIIKETDSHNAALRAKEIADARTMMGIDSSGIHNHHEDARTTANHTLEERRGITKITALIPKSSDPTVAATTTADDMTEAHPPTPTEPDGEEDQDIDVVHAQDRDQHRDQDPRHHHKHRHVSPSSSTPPAFQPANNHNTSPLPSPKPPSHHSDSDSDPLNSLIGPLPPRTNKEALKPPLPLRRGRGTHTLHSTSAPMDTHFTSTYDPTLDIQPTALDLADDKEGGDWDNALEALRDRAKWRARGAERLRAAGFTEEEVGKWEKKRGDGEGREEDVRWRGPGEGREWDRGKVLGDDGVQVEAEWGRLKGS
ncbi:MAG: hypothetical protein Q9169_003606 [Polycauliona sp. 2 TL-2023]